MSVAILPPTASVILPCFNSASHLDHTLNSLSQHTYDNFEVIAINDGSTDSTLQILENHRLRDRRFKIFSRPNRGLVPTLNEGIDRASGKFIARLDHDDIAYPDRLRKQIEFLKAHPNYSAIGTNVDDIDDSGQPVKRRRTSSAYRKNRPDSIVPVRTSILGTTMMMRAEALRSIGGFREQYLAAEDRDAVWRLSRLGEVGRLDNALVAHRVHANNMSNRLRRKQLYSAFLSDCSASAAHYGLDDSRIVERMDLDGDYKQLIGAYRTILEDYYPLELAWLLFATRFGLWDEAGFQSKTEATVAAFRLLIKNGINKESAEALPFVIKLLRS